jgi:hypothetical protein
MDKQKMKPVLMTLCKKKKQSVIINMYIKMRQYRLDSIFVLLKDLKHRLKQKKRRSLSLLTEE